MLLEKEMATHSSILAPENPEDRENWRARVHGVARVRHHLATKPPKPTTSGYACIISWDSTTKVLVFQMRKLRFRS